MENLIELRDFVLTWYNLPFTVALFAFLCLSFMQMLGLDQDPDTDVDLDMETDFDSDLDLDWEANTVFDAAKLLQFLGIGQIPGTMVILLLLLGFGISGWIANMLLFTFYPDYPGWAILPVCALALLTGTLFTAWTARWLGKFVPAFTTSATSVERLVSKQGWVSSRQVDEKYGQVKIRDAGGTLLTVFAVVDPGQAPIKRNAKVFLVEYNPAKKLFIVETEES